MRVLPLDIKDYIVPKPWGYEYLVFENGNIGIWWLHLNGKTQTSLHCHPDKKTGLIVLKGDASITFLSNVIPMPEFSKIMIREGVFHSTQTVSPDGIDILEIETPKDKNNLVRMSDIYGRKGKHYESTDEWKPRPKEAIWIDNKLTETVVVYNYVFRVESLNTDVLQTLSDDDIVIILSTSGIVSKDGFVISKGGDVIKVAVIRKLLVDFVFSSTAYGIIIRKCL